MPAFLAAFLAREGVQSAWAWVKNHAALVFFLVLALVLMASVGLIYSRAHKAGSDEVKVQVAQDQAKAVTIARHDEQVAQKTSDAVGAKVAAHNDNNHDETMKQIQEIKDELAKAKAAAAAKGGPIVADVVVPDVVRDKSNALVSDANGSADYTGPAH